MLATFKILEPYSESYLSNIIDRHLFVKILLLMQAKLAPKHGPHRCTAELMSPVMDLCNPSQRRLYQTAQSVKLMCGGIGRSVFSFSFDPKMLKTD